MHAPEKIVIAGGSGFIGRRLTRLLQQQGKEVGWLTRSGKTPLGIKHFQWDPSRFQIDPAAVAWATGLVVLSGEGIAARRWTTSRKNDIIQSRVQALQTLQQSLQQGSFQLKSVVSASAVGYYGNRGNEWLNETSAPGSGFLSTSTQAWEQAADALQSKHYTLAKLRIGLVLGREAGLLAEMDKVLSWHLKPLLGSGKQWYPWIHLDDVCEMISFALSRHLQGVYNATAPEPVTQSALLSTMAEARNTFVLPAPAPAFMLRLLLGEMAQAVLSGQRVSAQKIIDAGFTFRYPQLHEALNHLYQRT